MGKHAFLARLVIRGSYLYILSSGISQSDRDPIIYLDGIERTRKPRGVIELGLAQDGRKQTAPRVDRSKDTGAYLMSVSNDCR